MARALIHVPATAKNGEVIEIKTLISHSMETGYRIGVTGTPIPRDIIDDFVCTYNGEEVFRAKLYPAIAANPFISFFTVATESGTWRSPGPTSTARRKCKPPRSPWNEPGV